MALRRAGALCPTREKNAPSLTAAIQHVRTGNDPSRCQNGIDRETDVNVHVVRNAFLGGIAGASQTYDWNNDARLDCGIVTTARPDEILTNPTVAVTGPPPGGVCGARGG